MKNWFVAGAAAVALASCGGGSGGSGGGGGGGSSNSPPSFSPTSALDYEEGSGTDILALSASDPDGDSVTFSVASGKDGSFFTINGTALFFNQDLSFETPLDANGDNVYEVDITASDGTASVTRTVAVTITNAPEGVRLVNRGIQCAGSRGMGLIQIDDAEIGVVCEDGAVMLYNGGTRTSRLWVDTSADIPGEKLSSGFFYDAFFRRVFFVSTGTTTFSLHSYTYDNSLGTRDLTYEQRLFAEPISSLEFFSSAMQDCLNNELCLMIGGAATGRYVNEITALTLDDSAGLTWSESTLQSGLSWGGDMKRRERAFFVSTIDNAQIYRYEFDGGAFVNEVSLDDLPLTSIRPLAWFDGGIPSLSNKLLTSIDGSIYTIDGALLFDGIRDVGGVGIEDRSLDLAPDSGTVNFVSALLRLNDRIFVLDIIDGELFEIEPL